MSLLIIIFFVVLIICMISVIVCHYSIKISKYNIKNKKIPLEFDNFKIIHLSDLHSRIFDKDNSSLVDKIIKEHPNIIVMTGDMLNGKLYNICELETLIKNINAKKASSCNIYYVMGNREFRYNKESYIKLKEMLKENNVIILENTKDEIKIGKSMINIYGLNYFNRDAKDYYNNREDYIKKKKIEIKENINNAINRIDDSKYNILLAHDPNDFDDYANFGFDLILAGHIHGGVIRIPGIGGLLSPEITLFPKYDGGVFKIDKSLMCVSRGLGYGTIPFRLFNRPEIVCIKLSIR